MKFFVDSADLGQIQRWVGCGVASGVTTNPTILAKHGVEDIIGHVGQIIEAVEGLPVSIQVSPATPESILSTAQKYRALGESVVIKVPVVRPDGEPMLASIHELTDRGVPVNATCCMSAVQGIMAASAGARYVSLMGDRIADEGSDLAQQVLLLREWIEDTELDTEVIIGSVRSPGTVYRSLAARPHIYTVPPEVLAKCADHSYARRTVAEMEST